AGFAGQEAGFADRDRPPLQHRHPPGGLALKRLDVHGQIQQTCLAVAGGGVGVIAVGGEDLVEGLGPAIGRSRQHTVLVDLVGSWGGRTVVRALANIAPVSADKSPSRTHMPFSSSTRSTRWSVSCPSPSISSSPVSRAASSASRCAWTSFTLAWTQYWATMSSGVAHSTEASKGEGSGSRYGARA